MRFAVLQILFLTQAFSLLIAAEATFFRVEQTTAGHWLLIDPQGNPFYLKGLNHYGDGSYMPWNLQARYGDAQSWRRSLPERLREWGFNYLPTSIGPSAVDPATLPPDQRLLRSKRVTRTPEWPAEHFAELEFPFTIFLEYPKQYMSGPQLPDVFSQEFRDGVDQRCQEVCIPLKDNPFLIGYHYSHNPPWHPDTEGFDQWIESIVKPGSAAQEEWIRLMQRIYGSIDRWRATYGIPIETWEDIRSIENPLRGYVDHGRHLKDREAFMQRICREWYRVFHDTIRKYDTNHLILGDRNTLHLQPLPSFAIESMKPFIDVLSVNVMGPPDVVYGVLEQATRHWDGPIHLADTGAGIFQGEPVKSTYMSRDLQELERVYQGMMTMGQEHPQIIGFGWCGFFETPHPGGRSGLVDCQTGEPLPERLEVMRKWNAWIEQQPKFSKP